MILRSWNLKPLLNILEDLKRVLLMLFVCNLIRLLMMSESLEKQQLKKAKRRPLLPLGGQTTLSKGVVVLATLRHQLKVIFLIHLLILKLIKRKFQEMLQKEGVSNVKASDTCKLIVHIERQSCTLVTN